MKLYNTLTRKKQEFKPVKGNNVSIYSCGPTVYGLPHIGNYLSFFRADILKRWLEFRGYKVKHVMNVTDIDDKTIRDSKKEGLSLKEFTQKYEKEFLKGLENLNIKKASIYPRATENVPEMIELIKKLLKKGIAYITEDGIYFSISKFKDYGKLSKLNKKGIKSGARVNVDEYSKENPQDFALWKFSTKDEIERKIYFETPWGKGRPGWHIECSAMGMKYLGESFDIHTGGVDLIFPHHENEIAQSQGATEKKFVKYWVHNNHLTMNKKKMSKSQGNYFTLIDLLEKYSADTIRYFFLQSHYRDKTDYSEESIKIAEAGVKRLSTVLQNADNTKPLVKKSVKDDIFVKKVEKLKKEFIKAMDDDLNTPLALRTLHSIANEIRSYISDNRNKTALSKTLKVYKGLLGVFGLFEKQQEIDEKLIKKMINEREEARKKKDYKTADSIRDKLKEMKIEISDTKEGVAWRIIK
ncbi:MAG: cysteine--tRNA ligase [Candidatus Nanoarchaeia archaeon]|nr:cysteine--tRNA ligase [Candidatus Nanoarchaeia archaeon]